jgi:excisionase family DNA binding protein
MKPKDTRSNGNSNLLMTASTEPLWTVFDVANYLRLKQETVRMMARANKLPAIKVGKAWRFRIRDVKRVLIEKET